MNDPAPTVVGLYSFGSGEAVKVAEFRLTPDHRAVLTVIDPREAAMAQQYYDHGVDFVAEGRTVRADEGPAFLRALLQPFRMSYYRFVDESSGAAAQDRHR